MAHEWGVLLSIAALVLVLLTATFYILVPIVQDESFFAPCALANGTTHVHGWRVHTIPTQPGSTVTFVVLPAAGAGKKEAEGGGKTRKSAPHPFAGYVSVYFHGRKGNLESTWNHAWRDAQAGITTVLLDYRGYGVSKGRPTEQGLKLDGEAIVRHINDVMQVPRGRIILHGYSMGCGVALHLAQQSDDYAAVVLESPFADLMTATLHIYPYLAPFQKFMSGMFNNVAASSRVRHTPMYVTISERDECVSFDDAVSVFNACRSMHKRFVPSALESHAGPHLTEDVYAWLATVLALLPPLS